MKVLVDGYNVLKQITKNPHIHPSERTSFITELSRYARIKKLDMLLVFDGLPADAEQIPIKSAIRIHFSGANRSADDYLKDRLESAHHSSTLLVSSDRELVLYAQEYEIPSIDADYFYQLVRVALNHQSVTPDRRTAELVKTTQSNNSDLAALMEQWTQKIPVKDTPPNGLSITQQKSQQSKTEKKLLHILKKL